MCELEVDRYLEDEVSLFATASSLKLGELVRVGSCSVAGVLWMILDDERKRRDAEAGCKRTAVRG